MMILLVCVCVLHDGVCVLHDGVCVLRDGVCYIIQLKYGTLTGGCVVHSLAIEKLSPPSLPTPMAL